MKSNALSKPLPCTAGLLFAALLNTITPYSAYGSNIGAPLIDRAVTDTAVGLIYVLNTGFTEPGVVNNWAFYNNNSEQAGLSVTPLLLDVVNGDYRIRGIGASRANLATGIQSFNFDLISGTNIVTQNILFGWMDGANNGLPHTGVIEFDYVNTTTAGTQQNFQGARLFPGTNLGSGRTLGVDVGQLDRDYSVQATVATVPIPVAIWMFGSALIGLLGMTKKVAL